MIARGQRSYVPPHWNFYNLLRFFGTVEQTAKMLADLGYEPPPLQSIQRWRDKNSIPAPWVPVFLKLALEADLIRDIDDLKATR